MNTRPWLCLDFDGVISDPRRLKRDLAWSRYGYRMSEVNSKRDKAVGGDKLTGPQYQKLVDTLYETSLSLSTEPVAGAIEGIQLLKKIFQIKIVTSRNNKAVGWAKRWLEKYRLLDIIIAGTDNREKAPILAGCVGYVDDDLSKLWPLIGTIPHLYLFTWKYNAKEELPRGITRVRSWKELTKKLLAK